jgi:DNA polymerase-1
MEMNGITVDSDAFDKLSEDLEIKIKEVSKNIYDFVGHEFNIGSPKQVGQVLSEELGIKLKKNKLGNYQTGEEELVKLIGAYDIAGYILKFREYSKLKNTYTNGLKKFIGDDGKIHTTYHQTIASTGRLSSKDPNLQNIPKGSEFADKIKSAFTTDAGFKLVSFDYSQQELRILAYLSKEENLLEAYRQGHDVHRQTASKIFSVGYDEVTKDQRNVAKTVNFGLVYGQGAFGLSEQLQKPVQECQGFIDKFFESFPKLKNYFDELLVEGQSKGYIETIMGRRRGTNGLKSPVAMLRNAARRELVNFPIQGSAADMTKLAMVNLAKMNFTNSDECKLLLQVHDELVFKVKDDENLPKVCEQIKQIMCEVIDLGIPIEVDFRISDSWGA